MPPTTVFVIPAEAGIHGPAARNGLPVDRSPVSRGAEQ